LISQLMVGVLLFNWRRSRANLIVQQANGKIAAPSGPIHYAGECWWQHGAVLGLDQDSERDH
jgi:hypothetical protein